MKEIYYKNLTFFSIFYLRQSDYDEVKVCITESSSLVDCAGLDI